MADESNRIAPDVDPSLHAGLQRIAQDPFSVVLGAELLEVGPGHSRVALTVERRHLNSLGVAHGGALFALADHAFALASNSHGQAAVGVNVSISYVSPARAGERIIAEATEEHLGGRLALYRMVITTEAGKLVASCQGMVYRMRESLDSLQVTGA